MSVIRQVLTPTELKKISQTDKDYLIRQLEDRTVLNHILNKPVNQHLLADLRRLLDGEVIGRRKSGQIVRGQDRLTDGVRRPVKVRKMTYEECIKYGVDPAVIGGSDGRRI